MAIVTTTRRAIPLPDTAENVDVPGDLAAVGNSVDNDVRTFIGLESARAAFSPPAVTNGIPAGWKDGDRYISSDTGVEWARVAGAYVALNPKDPAANVPGLRTLGTGALQAAAGNDARLSDARTPALHAASHARGASDALSLSSLGLVMGGVSSTGVPTGGGGFTASRTSVGGYTVAFSGSAWPTSTYPVVLTPLIPTAGSGTRGWALLSSRATTGFTVVMLDATGAGVDMAFTFIAANV
jgi:hypothetical protein